MPNRIRCIQRLISALLVLAFACAGGPIARAEDEKSETTGNGGIFDFGKDPRPVPGKTRPQAATRPAQVGPVEVRVLAARLDYVTLVPSTESGQPASNADPIKSQDKFLAIAIELRNTGTDPVTYHSFAWPFGPQENATYAALAAPGRQMLTLVNFGDLEPAGLTRTAQIPPGKTVTDILVFLPNQQLQSRNFDAPLKLALPPQQLGATGRNVTLEIDGSSIQRP
ncbi:MAG TPA: hypothetical protein VH475_16385 [Tepidisphaeraceae bacterium]|jgi:hypothetical protein